MRHWNIRDFTILPLKQYKSRKKTQRPNSFQSMINALRKSRIRSKFIPEMLEIELDFRYRPHLMGKKAWNQMHYSNLCFEMLIRIIFKFETWN